MIDYEYAIGSKEIAIESKQLTDSKKEYKTTGREAVQIWDTMIDLVEYIEYLNRELKKKPKQVTRIRYKKLS